MKTTKNGRSKTKDAPKPAAKTRSAADEKAVAINTWRSRESGRFNEKKGPINGFDSPLGRF